MAAATQIESQEDRFTQQRSEVHAVLSSAFFQRAPKLSQILAYICDKYFEGTAGNLKEYSIAVEALGRSPGFDPHLDAIVRVDLHLLRKRLEKYYEREGKAHELRIVLPAGQYVPQFIDNSKETGAPSKLQLSDGPARPAHTEIHSASPAVDPVVTPDEGPTSTNVSFLDIEQRSSRKWRRWRVAMFSVLIFTLGVAVGTSTVYMLSRSAIIALRVLTLESRPMQRATAKILGHASLAGAPDMQDKAIRIAAGQDREYIDSSGFRWLSDRYFTGGQAFQRSKTVVQGTQDGDLFSKGRQGVFHYDIPVPPGNYEVHLLFAETDPGIQEGVREISFTVGAGQADRVDVVSDAGRVETATAKVYSNIRPGSDGRIHINFWSLDGFLNALEILPEPQGRPNPVRVSALPTLYTDFAGRHWLPDRYYMGGRNVDHKFALNQVDPPLFSRERYGNFSYSIPVAKGYSYRLVLYMAERYWGSQNSGLGGVGSRMFDVRCNDTELLHHFDILKAAESNSAVAVAFEHLAPDANGKLNISFSPVVNFPLVNAFEVEPE